MIGITRNIKQKVGRYRKNVLKKIKNLIWQNKNFNFDELDENWEA
jgi:hypothetical protein